MAQARFTPQYQENEPIEELYLDGHELEPLDDGLFYVEIERLTGLVLSDIPDGVTLEPILQQENDLIHTDIPMKISPYRDGSGVVELEFIARRKYWDEKAGLGAYIDAYLKSLELLRTGGHEITVADKQDDGDYVSIYWDLALKEDVAVTDAIASAKRVWEDADALTDQILYGYQPDPKEINDEPTFTRKVFIPLLVEMGFQDVKYAHGDKEFGKDVTFSRMDAFGVLRHFAAQIKFGNISGGAASELDTLIGQVNDAFAMPYIDLASKDQRFISTFYVVTSGSFTSNAEHKIINKLTQPAVRNNVTFMDGQKIAELVEQYSRAAQSP